MESDKRYFNGRGLYRLIGEGLESVKDAERIQDAINSGKHGKSTVWHRTWRNDDDENPIPGTFAVYQRIMHDRDVRSSEEDETRQPRSRREQCELDTLNHKLDDVNTKLNLTIASHLLTIFAGIGAYLHYVSNLTGTEAIIVMLLLGFVTMVLLWARCECRDSSCGWL